MFTLDRKGYGILAVGDTVNIIGILCNERYWEEEGLFNK
jgi:hypothetical protein